MMSGNVPWTLRCMVLVAAPALSVSFSLSSPCAVNKAFLLLKPNKGSCQRPTLLSSLSTRTVAARRTNSVRMSSDWSDFAYDDDDEVLDIDFADENDDQEKKAQVGMGVAAPTIDSKAEPILVPQGSALPLTEENVEGILAACRQEIGTMFGYTAENRGVGITGGVDFVELDGPTVVLSLKGRFWHQRPTVLARVGSYIQGRIPEVIDVVIDNPYQLTDEANNEAD